MTKAKPITKHIGPFTIISFIDNFIVKGCK